MKKRLLRFVFLLLLFSWSKIGITNSFFSDRILVKNNLFSSRCWISPSHPGLLSPANNSVIWEESQAVSWENSTSNCPIAQISYDYQISEESNFVSVLSYGRTNETATIVNDLDEGTFYWRVKASDQYNNTLCQVPIS